MLAIIYKCNHVRYSVMSLKKKKTCFYVGSWQRSTTSRVYLTNTTKSFSMCYLDNIFICITTEEMFQKMFIL